LNAAGFRHQANRGRRALTFARNMNAMQKCGFAFSSPESPHPPRTSWKREWQKAKARSNRVAVIKPATSCSSRWRYARQSLASHSVSRLPSCLPIKTKFLSRTTTTQEALICDKDHAKKSRKRRFPTHGGRPQPAQEGFFTIAPPPGQALSSKNPRASHSRRDTVYGQGRSATSGVVCPTRRTGGGAG